MNDVTVWSAAGHTRMRWSNGGGWTTEIIAEPSASNWSWRLSVADVDVAGPFSLFPGVDRSIALLRGNGFALIVGERDEKIIDTPFRPFEFAGDEVTTCRLIDGPVQDLNLMTSRSSISRRLDFIHIPAFSQWVMSAVDIAVVVAGRARVGTHDLGYLDSIRPVSSARPIEVASSVEAVVLATATAHGHR